MKLEDQLGILKEIKLIKAQFDKNNQRITSFRDQLIKMTNDIVGIQEVE